MGHQRSHSQKARPGRLMRSTTLPPARIRFRITVSGRLRSTGRGQAPEGSGGFSSIHLRPPTATLNNNQIGGSGAGAITDSLVGGYAMYAIQNSLANPAPPLEIRSKTSRAIPTCSQLIVTSGMVLTGTGTAGGPNVISQNVIHSLSNNSGAASNSIYALYCSFPATTANVVERNFVHSLSITSTATDISIGRYSSRGRARHL